MSLVLEPRRLKKTFKGGGKEKKSLKKQEQVKTDADWKTWSIALK